ncbi:unnamed protein product [Ambrosiozyma monospora]|uniref:Unnamed protein product n=1 Tax=Ambrosiozyma monospora TaxID=43982 RepID=A0A9W6T228_AMBMO|nr:unnamed protein product [Ambrosiozyma monospora]
MKLGVFRDKETLVVAVDDGRILVYDIERIVHDASKFKEDPERSSYDLFHVEPDHCMKGYSSVWGIDIYKNMIATADNCQMVKLFCFQDDVVISVQTHQVLHNIPSISFIPTQSENAYYISAVSISGELLIFKFPFTKSKMSPEKLVMFNKPVVINRALFNDNVWTTCTVDATNFKSVNSIQAMIGDPWIDMQSDLCSKILSESCILDAESDECHSSHLGLAAELQNWFVPTVSFSYPKNQSANSRFTTLTDTYRRIKKLYDDYYLSKQRANEKQQKSLNGKLYWESVSESDTQFKDKFILVTTTMSSGLFRANKLVCNATVSNVFRCKPMNEELSYSNRMSLALIDYV